MHRNRAILLILFLALLPFGAKALVLWSGSTGYLLQSLYKPLQLLTPFVWRWVTQKSLTGPLREKPSIGTLLIAILFALLASGIAIGLLLIVAPLLALDPLVIRAGLDQRFSVSPLGAVGVVLFLSTANALLEEWHFRLWLDRVLSEKLGKFLGITLSALAFGVMHVFIFAGTVDVPTFVLVLMAGGIAIMGAVWSLILRRTGGFYGAWLSHALTDAMLLGWGLTWLEYL